MNLVTVSGPPSSGKTAIILKTAATLMQKGVKVGVVKFDCLSTDDDLSDRVLDHLSNLHQLPEELAAAALLDVSD